MGKGATASIHTRVCSVPPSRERLCLYSELNVLFPSGDMAESDWHSTTGDKAGLHTGVIPHCLWGMLPAWSFVTVCTSQNQARGCSSSTPVQTVVFSAPGCFTFLEYHHRLKSPCSTYQCIHCALWVSNDHYVLFSLFELKHISLSINL